MSRHSAHARSAIGLLIVALAFGGLMAAVGACTKQGNATADVADSALDANGENEVSADSDEPKIDLSLPEAPPFDFTCPPGDYFIEVHGDGDAQVLRSLCKSYYKGKIVVPVGYKGACGDGCIAPLIEGCSGTAADGEVRLIAWLAKYGATYTRRDGRQFEAAGDATVVTVTGSSWEAGIEGSYVVEVKSTTAPVEVLKLSGAFHLCRAPDMEPPP